MSRPEVFRALRRDLSPNRSAKSAQAFPLLALLMGLACTPQDRHFVEVSCDEPSRYCVTRVDLNSAHMPVELAFQETPSAFAFDVRGGLVGVAELAVAGGPTIITDYELLGKHSLLSNSGKSAWVPVRQSSDPDELSTEYEFQLGGDVEELLLWHRYPRSFSSPREVDVHLVVDTELAAQPPEETVAAALEYWGMRLGLLIVSQATIPESIDQIGTHLWPQSVATTPHLTVVAANHLDGPAGAAVAGAPGANGGFAVYVAAASGDAEDNAAQDRLTLAHEMGHLAGLLHTSDANGHDALSDTAECAVATIEENPLQCDDVGNVMFYLYAGEASTEQQRRIVQDSLLSAPLERVESFARHQGHRRVSSTARSAIECNLGGPDALTSR